MRSGWTSATTSPSSPTTAASAGAQFASGFSAGLTLREQVPQGHKVALVDIAEGERGRALQRGHRLCAKADRARAAGCTSACCACRRRARSTGCRSPRCGARPRRRSKASRSRAIATPTARSARATSWRSRRPCSASPASSSSRSRASRPSCCRSYPNVDDVVALEHTYGCGVAIDAPDAMIPIRTLRNISLNPNFGGEVMVVSLGCEKLQPERLLPPGTIRDPTTHRGRHRRRRRRARRRVPAGRRARRLHVDDRIDHAPAPTSTWSG